MTILRREQCPACAKRGGDTSKDNLVVYKNGVKCFACGYSNKQRDAEEPEDMLTLDEVAKLPIRAMDVRGISQEIAKKYGVRCETNQETGEPEAFYYPLYRGRELAGYQRKVARPPGKRQKRDVSRIGQTGGSDPFGAHLMQGGGKFVIVTEGAEDCLAVQEMLKAQGKKWRSVATLGTNGWNQQLEWFEQFDKVAIAFDPDEPGQEAARQFAAALSPGKAALVHLGELGDPNLCLSRQNGSSAFLEAVQKAQPYRPDGILYGEVVWDRMQGYVKPNTIPYPPEWALLGEKMEGLREGEISLWTAGSSIGKTSYIRRLKQHVLTSTDWKIGEIELEERPEKTWRGLMQFHMAKRWADMTASERRRAYEETYGSGRIFTLDHRSQYGRGQSLIGKFKHLHYGMGAKIIFLDHITLAVAEFGDGQGNLAQDQMMNEFLEFVETTNTHLCIISHLRKALGGKSFEEGAVPSMDDLKGSGSIKQISFDIIGVSRNMQAEDDYQRNVSQLHVLKCRETGNTGKADALYWDAEAQKLVPAEDEFQSEEEEVVF